MAQKEFQIPIGNKFTLQIHCKKKNTSASKTFTTNIDLISNIEKLQNNLTDKKGDLITIKLVELKTKKSKTINIHSQITEIKKVIDNNYPQGQRYRVVINNLLTNKIDKKGFMFLYDGTVEQCSTKMQLLINNIIQDQYDKDIVFVDDKKTTNTHRVFIHKCGDTECYNNIISKSFSIKIMNYSSGEIIELIKERIQNGKN